MLVELLMVLIALLIVFVLFKLLKNIVILAINSFLALVGLYLANAFLGLGIAINLWSVLIVALGGIPGLLLVAILNFLGIAF
jgi:hypothetical protein